MKKIQRAKKEKSQHVLAKLREVINASQKSAPDDLGIPTDTCASIESGRVRNGRRTYHLTEAVARRVSSMTGISPGWLLQGDVKKPLVTSDGKPYTRDIFERVRFERESFIAPARKQGNECYRFYLLLCIKLGRVMLAATDGKDAKFSAWKIRHELLQIGAKYPAFESKDVVNCIVKNQTAPESFDYDLQHLMNTGTKPKKLWAIILDRFNKELCAVESAHAKAAARKPKVKPAKPTRR